MVTAKVFHATSELGRTYNYTEFLQRLSEQNPSLFMVMMNYVHVADVALANNDNDTELLNSAFELTNHIVWLWWENAAVTRVSEAFSRSTSVGDIIKISDKVYIVESIGFRLLGEL